MGEINWSLTGETMTGSARMFMSNAGSTLLLSGTKCPDEIRLSITTPARLCLPSEQQRLRSNCGGSACQRKRPEQARGLRQRRFPSKGLSTTVLDLKCLRMKRGSVIFAGGLGDEGLSLNRKEVVELLSVVVHTLLKPENQKLLLQRLEKRKQQIHQKHSKVPEQSSIVDQRSSPASANSLQDVGEVRQSEMEGDIIDSARCPSDQASSTIESVTITTTSLMTELVESEGQSQSIETMESSTEGVEGKGDKSLTSIRRLKVLNVHSYVHNALRESALRSWLHSRTIEE